MHKQGAHISCDFYGICHGHLSLWCRFFGNSVGETNSHVRLHPSLPYGLGFQEHPQQALCQNIWCSVPGVLGLEPQQAVTVQPQADDIS